MNKLLLILSLLYVFYSNQTFANCDFCCTDGKELFCKYAKSEDECTGGCGCCEPDKIYEPKSGYLDCCNGTPFKNGADTNACCDTNNGKAVANVQGADGLQYCCPADKPNAYWYNGSVTCCKGQFKCTTFEGKEHCMCCDGNLTTYYPNYYDDGGDITDEGSPALGCCVNDPSESYRYIELYDDEISAVSQQVCCPDGVYAIGYGEYDDYHYGYEQWSCYSGPTTKVREEKQSWNGTTVWYSYCPNGCVDPQETTESGYDDSETTYYSCTCK